MKGRRITLLAVLLATTLASPATAKKANHYDRQSWAFANSIQLAKIVDHLKAFQAIANANGGTRALGTPGYDASLRYVARQLRNAGYQVTLQPFIANLFVELEPPVFERVSPPKTYVEGTDFFTMEFSGSGDVTRPVVPIDIKDPNTPGSSTSGCEAGDFPAATSGNIALIQRGTCTFGDKAKNAAAAGAVGVIIFNEGQPGRTDVLNGTLGEVVSTTLPVVGTSFAVGAELYAQAGVQVHLDLNTQTTPVPTNNLLAEKRGRVSNQDVVVGAHLDSVLEGPGINDNGSGSAAILTIAEQLAKRHVRLHNTVRFAFWGAEESGLIGSTFYVDSLTEEQFNNIALNLNFDMVGSLNFVRFVYDGDGTLGTPGPAGSDIIEAVFTEFFVNKRQASEPTPFDGRSDYFAFINAGIPAGGLFSGAEGIKTNVQERLYGGQAGEPYDPCYHQACDTIRNLSSRSLDQLGKAAAYAVHYFGTTREDITPDAAAAARVTSSAAQAADYRGPHLIR
jgi:Zn-dependent M28 family amino/carboxypeptidase